MTKEAPLQDVVNGLSDALTKVSGHLIPADWQQAQLKQCKDNMPPKSAVIIMDYTENYSCTSQDEVQSAHWSNTQITIHPVVRYTPLLLSSSGPYATVQEAFLTDVDVC